MGYILMRRKWTLPRWPFWALMGCELVGLIPLLVLFGIAQPDLYRTKLWEIGHFYKFNSDPRMILYAYANYQPLPTIPMVWSQFLTNFNVAISIVTLFMLLVKLIAFIMKVYYPLLSVIVNAALVAIWTVSVYGQMGPDYADPRYPSPIAWYISKSCSYAEAFRAFKSCQLAKGTFAATVFVLFLMVVNLGVGIYGMVPNEKNNHGNDTEDDDSPVDPKQENKSWEMTGIPPASPRAVPYTPRTMAFHTLDRKLPLRTQYG